MKLIRSTPRLTESIFGSSSETRRSRSRAAKQIGKSFIQLADSRSYLTICPTASGRQRSCSPGATRTSENSVEVNASHSTCPPAKPVESPPVRLRLTRGISRTLPKTLMKYEKE